MITTATATIANAAAAVARRRQWVTVGLARGRPDLVRRAPGLGVVLNQLAVHAVDVAALTFTIGKC
jgi:hypothetical protein